MIVLSVIEMNTDYKRPKRRPPSREHVTISRLLCSTGLAAVTIVFVPYTWGHEADIALPIVLGFLAAAIGVAFRGVDGLLFGALIGGILIPVLIVAAFILMMSGFMLYSLLTGLQWTGLGA